MGLEGVVLASSGEFRWNSRMGEGVAGFDDGRARVGRTGSRCRSRERRREVKLQGVNSVEDEWAMGFRRDEDGDRIREDGSREMGKVR